LIAMSGASSYPKIVVVVVESDRARIGGARPTLICRRPKSDVAHQRDADATPPVAVAWRSVWQWS